MPLTGLLVDADTRQADGIRLTAVPLGVTNRMPLW
jgi:hypothetical protein